MIEYSDARTNLELMNSRIYDRIDPVPEFFLGVWMKRLCYVMDSDSWAVAFIVLLCLSVAMLLLFLLSGSVAGRRTGFFTGLAMILLAASALSMPLRSVNPRGCSGSFVFYLLSSAVRQSGCFDLLRFLCLLIHQHCYPISPSH